VSWPREEPGGSILVPVAAEAAPSGDHGLCAFDAGFLVGVLVGEGHFGGDGRQPQVTLRMHTDHRALFEWLVTRIPGSRLYGPYEHAGRRYYQWMARGACLRETVVPVLDAHLRPEHSRRAWERYERMKTTYGLASATTTDAGPDPGTGDS
jgi:hypothetical protein